MTELDKIRHEIKELFIDLAHEIEKAEEAFPSSCGGSVLADFQNATRRVALTGIHSANALVLSRLGDFTENTPTHMEQEDGE